MTLQQRFAFYCERNPAPLAYYFARQHHAGTTYRVPEFLAYVSTARTHRRAAVQKEAA